MVILLPNIIFSSSSPLLPRRVSYTHGSTHFSSFSKPIIHPAMIDITRPVPTYIAATFHPNIPYRRITATSLIMGDEIRKENVTPRGTPDSTKPRNKGIAEHEQNGVTMPNADAIKFPVKVFFPSSALRVRSGVKYVLIMPTKKIMSVSNIMTFGNSKTKNRRVSVICAPLSCRKPNQLTSWLKVEGNDI